MGLGAWDAFGSAFPPTPVTITGDTDTAAVKVIHPEALSDSKNSEDGGISVFNLKQVQAMGVSPLDVSRCIRRSLVQHSGAVSTHLKGSCFAAWLPLEGESELNMKSGQQFMMDADSTICFSDRLPAGVRLIGVFANKKLSIYDISSMVQRGGTDTEMDATSAVFSGLLLGEQSMSVPLTYWSFRDKATIVLVTHASVFFWSIASPVGSTHPVKLCERIDNADPTKYESCYSSNFLSKMLYRCCYALHLCLVFL